MSYVTKFTNFIISGKGILSWGLMYHYYIKFREWDSSLSFWIVWWDFRVLRVPMNSAKMSNSSFHIWIGHFGIEINQMLAQGRLGKGTCQYRNARPCQEKLNNFFNGEKYYRVPSMDY